MAVPQSPLPPEPTSPQNPKAPRAHELTNATGPLLACVCFPQNPWRVTGSIRPLTQAVQAFIHTAEACTRICPLLDLNPRPWQGATPTWTGDYSASPPAQPGLPFVGGGLPEGVGCCCLFLPFLGGVVDMGNVFFALSGAWEFYQMVVVNGQEADGPGTYGNGSRSPTSALVLSPIYYRQHR